jgi:hypothetical protein
MPYIAEVSVMPENAGKLAGDKENKEHDIN